MAVRFHLPSKVYEHKNAADGRRAREHPGLAPGRGRRPSTAAASTSAPTMDDRSILLSTVILFASAILLAVLLLGGVLFLVVRRGRRDLAAEKGEPPREGGPAQAGRPGRGE